MKKTGFIFLMLVIILTIFAEEIQVEKVETVVADSIQTPQITFIELGSVNCVPCRMMQPVMKQIEEAYAGTVKVLFYDVWEKENKKIAKQYGIKVIPTQVFLDESGKEFFRHKGFFSKEEIVELIEKQLKR